MVSLLRQDNFETIDVYQAILHASMQKKLYSNAKQPSTISLYFYNKDKIVLF